MTLQVGEQRNRDSDMFASKQLEILVQEHFRNATHTLVIIRSGMNLFLDIFAVLVLSDEIHHNAGSGIEGSSSLTFLQFSPGRN